MPFPDISVILKRDVVVNRLSMQIDDALRFNNSTFEPFLGTLKPILTIQNK